MKYLHPQPTPFSNLPNIFHLIYVIALCTMTLTPLCLVSCSKAPTCDTAILNASICTMNPDKPEAEAVAIANGRIQEVGTNDEIRSLITDATQVIDAQGQFLIPGFIEGHGHFGGMGAAMQDLNLLKTASWQEIVDAVQARVPDAEPGDWIVGRGWHQEKWHDTIMENYLGYPYHDALSSISPNNPVLLEHASGHGLMANARAMEIAGVTSETLSPSGGNIVRDHTGRATGVFEENAAELIEDAYREYLGTLSEEELLAKWHAGIELAQQECLRNGVTSFQDAGSSLGDMERFRKLAEEGKLDIRLWAMIRHESDYLSTRLDNYPLIDAGDGHFTCRAVKLSIDGALGSYGAWLLEPYNDNPGFHGQNTKPIDEMDRLAALCIENKMQFCVHAIGDRANREVLDAFERAFQENGVDGEALRWRIEHSQHLHPADIGRFGQLGVIASMQGIHCTSDAPYVVKRLGEERSRTGAYAWRSLLDSDALVTNGTDVPVEDISPIESYYASVTRRRSDNNLVFFPEQRMTRMEALVSYTISNARAAFEESVKGSVETGKYADLVILSNNLLTCDEAEILETKVLLTMVGGEIMHQDNSFLND